MRQRFYSALDTQLATVAGEGNLFTVSPTMSSRVAQLCVGQDMGSMCTATAFMEMETGSLN